MATRRWYLTLSLWLASVPVAMAVTVLSGEVAHEDGHYRVAFEVLVDADLAAARRLLTDYAHYRRLSDTLVESRVLAVRSGGATRVRFVFRACVLFFCPHFQKTADVEAEADGTVVMRTDPAESDFRFGEERWRVTPAAARTRIRYEAEFVPSFFVPPLIGPWLVKWRIRDELETTAQRLEALAAGP